MLEAPRLHELLDCARASLAPAHQRVPYAPCKHGPMLSPVGAGSQPAGVTPHLPLQIVSVDEHGLGIKRIRPKSLLDMLKVRSVK